MNSVSIYICIIVVLFGCRDLPSVDTINELDPFSLGYRPLEPTINSLDTFSSEEYLRLEWNYDRSKLDGITGFEVYVSLSDTNSFELRKKISKTDRIRYTYDEAYNPEVFNYLFKVRAYFEQLDGVAYSDFVSIEFSENIPQAYSQVRRHPFIQDPAYEIIVSVVSDEEIGVEVFLETEGASLASIYTTESSPALFNHPLDVSSNSTKFYYKLFNDFSESKLIPFNEDYTNQSFNKRLEIASINASSLEMTINRGDSLLLMAERDTLYYDSYDLTITNSNGEIFLDEQNLLFNSPLQVENLNTSHSYTTTLRGRRGSYSSNPKAQKFILMKRIQDINRFDIFYHGLNDILIDVDTVSGLFYAASNTSIEDILINTSTEDYRFYSYPNFPNKRIGKFPPQNYDFNSEIYFADSKASIKGWEITSLRLNYIIEESLVTSQTFQIFDFEFHSDQSLIYMAVDNAVSSALRIFLYNFQTESHEALFEIENIYPHSARILYDKNENRIFVFFREPASDFVHFIVYDLDIGSKSPKFETRLSGNSYDIKFSNHESSIYVFDDEKYIIVNIDTESDPEFLYDTRTSSSSDRIDVSPAYNSSEVCFSYRSLSQFGATQYSIECRLNDEIQPIVYYKSNEENDSELLRTYLNHDATKLYLLFAREFAILKFKEEWALY